MKLLANDILVRGRVRLRVRRARIKVRDRPRGAPKERAAKDFFSERSYWRIRGRVKCSTRVLRIPE